MEVLKNHYEKIVLSVTLLALAATAAWLFMANQDAQAAIGSVETTLPQPKAITPLDLSQNYTNLERVKNPPNVKLGEGHNLFNPVSWKQKPDGSLLKIQSGNEEGAGALKVSRIQPLHFTISLDRVTGGSGTFSVIREADPNPANRRKATRYASMANPRSEFFTLVEIKGSPENPTEWILELAGDQKQKISISPEKPFSRVDGYAADLIYSPENKNFNDVRQNQSLSLGGEQYKIVAITQNEVRLAAISTGKQFTKTVQN